MESKQIESELSVIRTIMEDSRMAVYDSGTQGIFWSMLIAGTLIINYAILISGMGYQYLGLTWLVLMTLGTAVSVYIGIKEKKIIRVKTFAVRILTSIWTAIGVSNSIFAAASVLAGVFHPLYIIPLDSFVIGMGFYVTSVVLQMKVMKVLSYLWWIGGILFLAFPSIHCILFFSVMFMVSILIPVRGNRKKWKMEFANGFRGPTTR